MYFNTNVDGTNIDKEFNKKEKFNFDKYKKYIFIGLGCILILGLIFIFIGRKKISYYIDLSGNREITIYKGDIYIEPGYTARDSKGNDLTDKVVVNNMIDTSQEGEYQVIYILGDIKQERIVKVIKRPLGATVMYLKGSTTVYLKVGDAYEEPGYKVIDSVDGNLGDKVTVTGRVNTSEAGTYKITYTVTNNGGVTTSKQRVIVVMDSNISLTLDNEDYTNKNVNINIYVMDNYFDYLILPNGNKVTSKSYTYEVSDNGEYKFIIYNKLGEKTEKTIRVKNIDKVSPTGSCSGTYGNGKSNITIKSSDNIGISKYILNNNTYTTSKITLNKELSMVNITIYDLAGNTTSISCNLGKSSPSSSTNSSSSKPTSSSSSSKPSSSSSSKPNYAPSGYFTKRHSNGLKYVLFVPKNTDLNKNTPLIVSFHGGYGVGNCKNNTTGTVSYQYLLTILKENPNTSFPAIVLAPRSETCNYRDSNRKVSEIIMDVIKEYNIDTDRIALTGYSQGAAGALDMMYQNYNASKIYSVAAIISPAATGTEYLTNYHYQTPLWVFSSNDEYQAVYNFATALNKSQSGRNFHLTTLTGTGHSTDNPIYKYTDLAIWLTQQRKSNPVNLNNDSGVKNIEKQLKNHNILN